MFVEIPRVANFLYESFIRLIWPPFAEGFHWLFMLSAILAAYIIYLKYHGAGKGLSLPKFVRWCVPAEIYGHRSAIVDYKWYLVNGLLNELFHWSTLIVSSYAVGKYVVRVLEGAFSASGLYLEPSWLYRAAYTLLMVLAFDLGFFIAHWLQHKVPFFWQFHKVHHSAEVLTPITGYRFHPVDSVLQGCIISVTVGTVLGGFKYMFSDHISEFTVRNLSLLMLVYYLTANLRHSHIWLSYGWHLSHILSSPAQHQIHHSSDARHVDKNLGIIFSVWDWLAGTLYIPRERELLKLGLPNSEQNEFSSVYRCYAVPVYKAFELVRPGSGRLSHT